MYHVGIKKLQKKVRHFVSDLRALAATFLKNVMSLHLEQRLKELFKYAQKKLVLALHSRIESSAHWGHTLPERVQQHMPTGVELLMMLSMEGDG